MEKIAEIKEKFSTSDVTELSELISLYEGNERSGVQAAVATARKRIAA